MAPSPQEAADAPVAGSTKQREPPSKIINDIMVYNHICILCNECDPLRVSIQLRA